MQKHIIKWSFWLGVLASVLALTSRLMDVVAPTLDVIPTKGDSIGFNAFMHGAFLFFAATVAATCYAWSQAQGVARFCLKQPERKSSREGDLVASRRD